MLGTPDAYLLPPFPGAAYLKVDTAIYERFKVALVSGSGREEPDEPRGPWSTWRRSRPSLGGVAAGRAAALPEPTRTATAGRATSTCSSTA